MISRSSTFWTLLSFAQMVRKFALARHGNIGIMTALLMVPMMTAAGAAIDWAFAVKAQGKLEQAAQIASTTAANTARRVVNSYTKSTGSGDDDENGLGSSGSRVPTSAYDKTATDEGARVGKLSFIGQASLLSNLTINDTNTIVEVVRVGNTINASVKYTGELKTLIMKLYGVQTITLTGKASMIVGLLDKPIGNQGGSATAGAVISETWTVTSSNPVKTGTATTPVINDWYSGTPGSVSPLITSGDMLDPSKAPTALRVGNPEDTIAPIISKKVYLPKGDYELRYWYRSTVVYPEYEPVFICGTVEAEMNWVRSFHTRDYSSAKWKQGDPVPTRDSSPSNVQTARAGVYLDPILSNPQLATTPPTLSSYSTPPADPNVANNRVDICAYSSGWIQRSVPINITDAGYFWLSFVSEPPTGSKRNGFYLGPLEFCPGTSADVLAAKACVSSLNENRPWAANTTLYKDTFDESPSPTVDANFQSTRSIFTTAFKYERAPDWALGRFGGNFTADGFQYKTDPTNSSNTIVRSTTLGVWLYRRMLLMPGVYKFKFKASANENFPTKQWCQPDPRATPAVIALTAPTERTSADGSWVLRNGALGNTCTCPAGYITTLIGSDEAQFNQANKSNPVTAPAIYRTGSGQGLILSDCHLGNSAARTTGDVYCVLIPRTQYYGFRLAMAGPTLTQAMINSDPAYSGYDTQLNTNGSFFDGLEVTLLSPGVRNRFFATSAGPGDFDSYNPECVSSLAGSNNATTPTNANIITGGIPMWPGVTTNPLNRLIVTAPLN